MNIRMLSIGVAAITLAGIGGAAAQSVYVERITPAPVYTPSDIDGYVIEQRYVPVAPATTYENQVITPSSVVAPRAQQQVVIERRIETPMKTSKSSKATQTRVVTERRVIVQQPQVIVTTEPPYEPSTSAVTETNALSSCHYDFDGRMICD